MSYREGSIQYLCTALCCGCGIHWEEQRCPCSKGLINPSPGCSAGALRQVPPRGSPLWPRESLPADHSDGSSWKRGSRWRSGMHGTAPGSGRGSESSPGLLLLPAHLEPQPHRGRWEAGSRLHLSGAPELRAEL